jgi:hypothetical protein
MNNNIFINCPFDKPYIENLLKPMLYAVIDIGFEPQLALNRSDSSENRLDKIVELIKNSEYSIHYLSLIKSSKIKEYYRLNMPFELGIDYGIKISDMPNKKFLILEAEKYEYQKALSDINGWDIKCHNNNTDEIIKCVRSWCAETVRIKNVKSGSEMAHQYLLFSTFLFELFFIQHKQQYNEPKARELTIKHIEEITIIEYIKSVKHFLDK